MKQMIFILALLSAVVTASAQSLTEDARRDRLGWHEALGIGIGIDRLYSDFGLNSEPGGNMPLVIPELEFNIWYAYVAIGAWRQTVGTPFSGVKEKIGTALWKVGPVFRYGRPHRCWTFTPYVGSIGSWTSWDEGAETFGVQNRDGKRFMAGLRVGLTRKCFECALHASNRECGLSVLVKFGWDEND